MTSPRREPRGKLHVVGGSAGGERPADRSEASEEVNAGQLRAFVERIERLKEEEKALSEDIKEVFAEAKGNGFDPKIIRKIVSIRGQDAEKRAEEETILDLYLAALGAS